MSYTKTQWVNNTTPINDTNLNKIEQGIYDNSENIDTLQTQITAVASGSPAGVYATVSDLTTADPDHSKIYVVSADGHWYYYANSQWNDGGIYQATVESDEVEKLNDYVSSIKNTLQSNNIIGLLDYEHKFSTSYNTTSRLPNWQNNANYKTYNIPVTKPQGFLYISKYNPELTTTGQKYCFNSNGEIIHNFVVPGVNQWVIGLSITNDYYVINLATAYNYGVRMISWTWDTTQYLDYFINGKNLIDLEWLNTSPSDNSVSYNKLGTDVKSLLNSNPKILIPENINCIVGTELNLYKKSFIATENFEKIFVDFSYTGHGLHVYNDRASIIETTEGEYTLTVKICQINNSNDISIIHQYTYTIKAFNFSSNSGKIICLGDSRTASGIYVDTLNSLNNLTFLGTRETENHIKHEGRNGWSIYNYLHDATKNGLSNPFYNSQNPRTITETGDTMYFDFAYYMNQQNYNSVDYVAILLGANDAFTQYSVIRLNKIIENIHSFNSNIKVLVMNEYISPDTGSTYERRNLQRQYYTKFEEQFGARNNIYIVPLHLAIDDNYDFPHSNINICQFNNNQISVVSDFVHLNNFGYIKLANFLNGYINSLAN